MYDDCFVPYDGHKLHAGEDRTREDGGEMEEDAEFLDKVFREEEALGRKSRRFWLRAEDTVEIEIHEAREAETHEGPEEYDKKDKVVPLAEANGIVDFPGVKHKGVCGWACWLHHLGERAVSESEDAYSAHGIRRILLSCWQDVHMVPEWA